MLVWKCVIEMALFLVLGLVAVGWVTAQGGRPLSESDLARLIELEIDGHAIVAMVQEAGIAFAVDAAVLDRLQKAGAPDALLAAIGGRCAPCLDAVKGP
jgi:hypothetical protein